jgi:rhomboid protease GluP
MPMVPEYRKTQPPRPPNSPYTKTSFTCHSSRMNEDAPNEWRTTTDRQLLNWMLVLSSANIRFSVLREGAEWQLSVAAEHAAAAAREIETDQQVNKDWPPPERLPDEGEHKSYAAYSLALVLGLFYFRMGSFDSSVPVHAAGAALGSAIREGEWWRTITALTLHADGAHLIGNLLFLTVFTHALCRKLGDGLGMVLIILSGALGNTLVAWTVQNQMGIGASTASFGVLGLLVGMRGTELLRHKNWRDMRYKAILPIGAGLAMLAITGNGGGNPQVDLAAHLYGFIIGAALAVPFGFPRMRIRAEGVQRALELLVLLTICLAWMMAYQVAA